MKTEKPKDTPVHQEHLLTLKQVSVALNIEYRQLLRGAREGAFPIYVVANSRQKVFLSEVLACMRIRNSQDEGENHV